MQITAARNPHDYCPECHYWDLQRGFWPGSNGLVEKQWCSYCGYFGDAE